MATRTGARTARWTSGVPAVALAALLVLLGGCRPGVPAPPALDPGAVAAAPVPAWVVVRRAGSFIIRTSAGGGAGREVAYGLDGDFPLVGDWTGDGTPGVGVVRGRQWLLRSDASAGPAETSFGFARPGDVPVTGDWDGDGRDGVGVARAGTWYLRQEASAGAADVTVAYGRPDDLAVTGDWDGDGRTEIGVYRNGTWLLNDDVTGSTARTTVAFGRPTDRPVVGDWDGDGRDGIGVVRDGRWFVRDDLAGATRMFTYGSGCDLPLTSSTALAARPGGGVLRPDQRGREIEVLPTSDRLVALTFDAGANADALPGILDTLRRRCVPGTFFFTGQFARSFPGPVAAAGLSHPVGNHSDTHPDFTTLGDDAIRTQVRTAQASLLTATRQDTRPMFRYPFGARDTRTHTLVAGLGYTSVRWTVDTLGWKGTSGGQSVDGVVARVLAALRPGEIVLMHVGSHPTDGSMLDAAALPRVIDQLRARGYAFTTVDSWT